MPPTPEGTSAAAAGRLGRLLDPVGLGSSLARAMGRAASDPDVWRQPTARYLSDLFLAWTAAAGRLVGADIEGPVAPAKDDNRFADDAWSQNAFFYGLQQLYLLNSRLTTDLVDGADLPQPGAAKARFMANLVLDALAPTNYLWTNPKALKRAFDTGGVSVARGGRHFLHDLLTNGGWPTQVKKGQFVVGKNMAASKGRVVLRNDLMELIQYGPLTPEVYSVPLLFCPPWINKYYIMDLAPGKSLVEWALEHGLTVFAISYRNPDSSMRDVSFDDYMFQGPRAAIDAVRSITGAAKVNTLSVCLGGTLNAALVAYLQAQGEDLINSSTYLNTTIDFTDAGVLQDVFTDPATVEGLVEKMGDRGYLDAGEMAHTFDLLRANDLVFRYVASSWLMGEDPPAFDLLAWNNDSTRMPAKMHSYYLRRCWVENALARDDLEVAGTRLAVSETTNDSYFVAALNDHIVPWRTNYRATQLFKGERRFVMTSGGHVAGIVNPPSPKSKLWTNAELPPAPDRWLADANEAADTWWNDWLKWAVPRSGDLGPPPPLGNERYPAGAEAPGSYVRG
jgi:polyhydroxyalkanoate synthase subunit PhaC